MHIHTVIDGNLFVQASRVAGVVDARLLLEHALRLLIQAKTGDEETTHNDANAATGFAAGLLCFRKTADLNHFIDINDFISGLRDKSPGRDIVL